MTSIKPSFLSAIKEFWPARELYMQLDYAGDNRLWDMYRAKYEQAQYGDTEEDADVFASFMPDHAPKTGEIVRQYRSDLMRSILRAYAAQYNRAELVAMLNLVLRGTGEHARYACIKLADGVEIQIDDLLLAWHDAHANEQKIIFCAPSHGGIV